MASRRANAAEQAISDTDFIPRNDKGGVLVTEEELRTAFKFFDTKNTGKITLSDLKKRLAPFYKNMPHREFKFLMGGANELTFDALKELLVDNEVKNFDPVAEAFKVYDPEGTGYVDTEVMKSIFEKLGFNDLSSEDIEILVETADLDKDGKISLQDFRNLLHPPVQACDAKDAAE